MLKHEKGIVDASDGVTLSGREEEGSEMIGEGPLSSHAVTASLQMPYVTGAARLPSSLVNMRVMTPGLMGCVAMTIPVMMTLDLRVRALALAGQVPCGVWQSDGSGGGRSANGKSVM
jgi:hypothetical protein